MMLQKKNFLQIFIIYKYNTNDNINIRAVRVIINT